MCFYIFPEMWYCDQKFWVENWWRNPPPFGISGVDLQPMFAGQNLVPQPTLTSTVTSGGLHIQKLGGWRDEPPKYQSHDKNNNAHKIPRYIHRGYQI